MTNDFWFEVLIALAITWLVTVFVTILRLKNHPSLYKQLDSPSLLTPTPASAMGLWSLFSTDVHRQTNDPVLSGLIYLLRVLFVVYILLFLYVASFVFRAGKK
jgi:hypothetical protein